MHNDGLSDKHTLDNIDITMCVLLFAYKRHIAQFRYFLSNLLISAHLGNKRATSECAKIKEIMHITHWGYISWGFH